jgi:hypothetical protein
MNINSPTPSTMPPPTLKRARQSAAGAAAGPSTASGPRAKRRKNEVDDTEGSEVGGTGRGGSGNGGKGKDEDGETEGQIKVCLVITSTSSLGPSKLIHIIDRF